MTSQARMKRPARARERIRLAAALGILAGVAIAAGGLASLLSGTPMLPNRSETDARPSPLDWVQPIETTTQRDETQRAVEQAETAAAHAQAVVERAQARGELDPATASDYRDRLERLGRETETPAITSTRPKPPRRASPRQALVPVADDGRGL